MSLIAANPGSSQSALARRAGITGPSLVGIMGELENLGLISRERSTNDRRRNMLVLTAQGQNITKELFKVVTDIEAPIREELGEEGLAQLRQLLDRALNALGRIEE